MVYNSGLLANNLTSHDQSFPQYPGLYTIWKYFKKFLFFHLTSPFVLRMVQNRILAKLNLWMVYNPGFLAYSLTSHDQSFPQYPGLYTIWKYF